MNKKILSVVTIATLFLANPAFTFAHVTVKPDQVGMAAYQTFTISVPNEKEIPTTSLRLVIPEGLTSITPNVKPGWKIDIKKSGTGESARVTEVVWSAGSIPSGQRDDFFFSTQAPAKEQTLVWKAYQTYSDGTVVAWDQDEKEDSHAGMEEKDETMGSASKTMVVNDLKSMDAMSPSLLSNSKENKAFVFSIAAFALSCLSISIQLRKKGKK